MKYDIVVIGGSAAGLIAAMSSRKLYKDKKILVIKKTEMELVPCGIPYTFNTLGSVENDAMGIEAKFKAQNVDLLIDEVIDGDSKSKKVITKGGKEFEYDKLIMATGSTPFVPPIPGYDLENTFNVPKDAEYLKVMKKKLEGLNDVVILGGGFIGVEVADEIKKSGKNVTLIEALPDLLFMSFDTEFGAIAKGELEKDGIRVLTSTKAKEITGNGKVEKIILENGEEIKTDAVVFSTGYRPNVSLAEKFNLQLTKYGFIKTDAYMRTTEPDIFAIGDCAQHTDMFTGKSSKLMLASAAVYDARIAASNLCCLRAIRRNKGSLSVYSTLIGSLAFGAAGVNEKIANQEGFVVDSVTVETFDRHPGKFADSTKTKFKLIFSKDSGIVLGAQIVGGKGVGEMVNIISLAIQMNATVNDLFNMQIGTHPLLTAAPTTYPIPAAAELALIKMKK